MGIPDYQSLMLPTLLTLADEVERPTRAIYDLVADAQGITQHDREVLLPSGKQTLLANRVGWALTYMAKAGLVRRPRRGMVAITERGREILAADPDRIDNRLLGRFPEFVEFTTTSNGRADAVKADHAPGVAATSAPVPSRSLAGSPTEAVAGLVEEINSAVAAEVLERVLLHPPIFLEHLVLRLLEAMGYGGVEAISQHLGGPGDEGLDGVIRQDALGLDVVYVQAKRYAPERKIGRPDIQAFVGALTGAQADRGIFITTSSFTAEARAYAERIASRIVLIDGERLATEMVNRNVGVEVREVHEVKRIDEDFFADA